MHNADAVLLAAPLMMQNLLAAHPCDRQGFRPAENHCNRRIRLSPTLAQTNLQLYQQLRAAGHSRQDLAILQRDNETACMLFGSKIRSTGRPFLCHAVGTASAALAQGASLDLVRTAFLHAAYKHGRFPDGTRGNSDAHRSWLRERTGGGVEKLVFAFSQYPFNVSIARKLVDNGADESQNKEMLLLKLCNDVDDTHDFGALLAHKPRYSDPHYLSDLETLSTHFGFDVCAEFFAQARRDMADNQWLDAETVYSRFPFPRSLVGEIWRRIKGRN
ncbi:hypothetical protein [Mesorhizobium sp. 10J20-29]